MCDEYFERYYESDEESDYRYNMERLSDNIESFNEEIESELLDYLKCLMKDADEVFDETTEEYWDDDNKDKEKFCEYYILIKNFIGRVGK